MIGADLAAKTILKAFEVGRFDRSVLMSYDRQWRQELGKEMWMERMGRRIFESFSDKKLDRLVAACQHPKLAATINNVASFDWHSKAVWSFLTSRHVLSQLF